VSGNHVWIIGAGGLLGGGLTRQISRNQIFTTLPNETINWADPNQVNQSFERSFQQLLTQAGTGPWTVIWAAGHASTSSTHTDTIQELDTLQLLINVIARSSTNGQGTFFLTSSAGGVYAGSQDPPFTINTEPNSLSAYGELKLAQENLAKEQLSNTCRVLIGRVSNLYGPGQDINKLQGLISQLVVSALTKNPLNIFVSLDTMRDYIYVDDAADTIMNLLGSNSDNPSTNIIASGHPVSLGYLIQLVQDISRTRIPLAIGAHSSSAAQARDLRLTPTAFPETSTATTLPAGIKNVYLDILQRRQDA
jgi:UDP-glucose 4-epimerase